MEGADRSPGDIARSAKKRVTVVRKLTFAATVDLERPAGADNAKIKDKAGLIFDELYDLWEPYEHAGLPLSQNASRENVIQVIVTRVEDLFQVPQILLCIS